MLGWSSAPNAKKKNDTEKAYVLTKNKIPHKQPLSLNKLRPHIVPTTDSKSESKARYAEVR